MEKITTFWHKDDYGYTPGMCDVVFRKQDMSPGILPETHPT